MRREGCPPRTRSLVSLSRPIILHILNINSPSHQSAKAENTLLPLNI